MWSVWPTIGNLDQVSVGVTKMNRPNRAGGPHSIDGALHDPDTVTFQVNEPCFNRCSGHETKVRGSPRGPTTLDIRTVVFGSEHDFLAPESEATMLVTDPKLLESEDAAVEANRMIGIANRQDQMIEPVDRGSAVLGDRRGRVIDKTRDGLTTAVDGEFEDVRP